MDKKICEECKEEFVPYHTSTQKYGHDLLLELCSDILAQNERNKDTEKRKIDGNNRY